MGIFASVNGDVVPGAEARISVFDTGFTFGDSVYETLRTYGGRPFAVPRHLRRLRASAARLGFEIPLEDRVLSQRLDALLARAANAESYIRWIVTRGVGDISYHFERVQGPTVVMVAKPYEPLDPKDYENGIDLVIASVRRNSRHALDPAIKSCNLLNNIFGMREAQARGAVEPVMLNEHGQVAEGASSNVFAVRDGALLTPRLDAGILAGITRDIVVEQAAALGIPLRESELLPQDLIEADEAFITSSLKEVAPVAHIDGRPVGSGRPGPITLRLLAAYRDYARKDCAVKALSG